MMHLELRRSGFLGILAVVAVVAGVLQPVLAQDVTRPADVAGLRGERVGNDAQLTWDAVTSDAAGNAEVIDHYNIYRGTTPDFVPDKAGGSNRIGQAFTEAFTDAGAAIAPDSYYYLLSAVDADGNESDTRPFRISTLPVVSGYWTSSTIEVSWTDAQPLDEVVNYRVYYGKSTRHYEFVDDVGLDSSHTLSGLQLDVNWYVAVTAVDANGNETPFSNEHIDAINGTVRLRAHDGDELCWGIDTCIPADPAKILRANGWQLLVPVHFPEGDWVSITVTWTIESRLCTPPAQDTVSKCGTGNPCVSPPCNGGYNPCGDPWDRLAHLFVVRDDCVELGGSCITQNNLELMRVVTPFGTDAEPPDGTGEVAPAKFSLDITPYASLLTGDTYIGAHIGHYVQKGWWVTVDFVFTERLELASPKPPADGIEIVGYGNAPLPTKQVSIPASANSVKMRLFTSGHGGTYYCDGGENDAEPCSSQGDCRGGGVCNPCDEFCHRTNRIIVDGTPVWEYVPWRTDCSPNPPICSDWNACGYPSCTYPRAGWCPGYIACHHNAPCDNDLDFTADLPPGGTYDIDYDVVPMNGTWPISLVLYWYE